MLHEISLWANILCDKYAWNLNFLAGYKIRRYFREKKYLFCIGRYGVIETAMGFGSKFWKTLQDVSKVILAWANRSTDT